MSTYEISKSALLSLKAEILKKQEELHKTNAENKVKLQQSKKPLELKNKGVESRAANDGDDISDDLLKKSRVVLEAKAKLYDKLSQGSKNEVEKEQNRQYLVHFDKKAQRDENDTYNQKNEDEYNHEEYLADLSDEEWVEFVDSFGRTRTCLKKDLHTFKEKDKSGPRRDGISPEKDELQENENKDVNKSSEVLSGDMRRELLRQQWEKEELKLADKSDVHYQDILFSEARTHGVSYYGFSKDEATRIKEQEALKKLRKETEAQQNLAQEVRRNRERQLAARIRTAKNRKRAREGLPPLTSDDEEKERALKDVKQSEDVETERERSDTNKIDVDEDEIKRQNHIRPWDIGKEGVTSVEEAHIRSGTRDPFSQDEWNDIQRSKRSSEFAPPQNYHSEYKEKKNKLRNVNPYKRPITPIDNECSSSSNTSDDELMKDYAKTRPGTNVPPPATYDYYGPNSKRSKIQAHSSHNMEDAIMAGLKYMREQAEKNKK